MTVVLHALFAVASSSMHPHPGLKPATATHACPICLMREPVMILHMLYQMRLLKTEKHPLRVFTVRGTRQMLDLKVL